MITRRARSTDDGAAAFQAQSEEKALAAARREAAAILREAAELSGTEEQARLFDVANYDPPRAITFRDENGKAWHKATEKATRDEAMGYRAVLEENAKSAQQRSWAFAGFLRIVLPYMAEDETTIGDALEALSHQQDERSAA
jgi:hypothetical protein